VMLHKDYGWKGSVEEKNCSCEPQGVWCQDKLIGGHGFGHVLFYWSVWYCSIFNTNNQFLAFSVFP
jgi:hypothetical protein